MADVENREGGRDVSKEMATVPVSDAASLMAVIARAASDATVDVTKLERLMAMYERIEAKRAEQAFAEAMNAAQGKMRAVSQDASNPQTRSKYASFAALDAVLRPIYTEHGFSLSYDTADAPEPNVRVVCRVSHRAGHSERPHLDMPADGKGAKGGDVMTKTHATMSAVSYARRGLLKMIFNIAEGEYDDDGNGAGNGHAAGNITAEQAATLAKIIKDNGFALDVFLKWAGVEQIADIPAANYGKAHNALMAKVAEKGKKACLSA